MKKPQRLRGLATVALLKTQFDRKQDHVSMFEPFLLDVICSRSSDYFTADELGSEFLERHGLIVPSHAFKILLGRANRRGYVKRERSGYIRQQKAIPNPRLDEAKSAVDAEHRVIASALRKFAESKTRQIESDDEALALLLAFLEENQFALLLDDPKAFRLSPPPSLSQRDGALVAAFLTHECLPSEQMKPILQRMLEGFVLQNALLMKDISAISGHFDDLTVFFDTRFLFAALGLHGAAAQQAAREDLDLLRSANARLAVFDKTLAEMRRVLSVYEGKLATTQGIMELFPGALTTYVISSRYRPSDVREVIALLERNIRELGLTVRTLPSHNRKYTLDEEDLARRISGPQGESEARVVHDVDCIAAVLTLRAGRKSDSWEGARVVFSTTTGRLVSTAVQWYRDSGEKGVPPLIHQFTLSSIAWLKRPASAQNLKLHQLVALCSAALRPSRQTWQAFLDHLKKLEKSGSMGSNEAIAIVAHELTQAWLLDVELESDDETPDAESLSEVVERFRATYRSEAEQEIAKIRLSAEDREMELRMDADSRVKEVQEMLGAEREANRQHELRMDAKATWVANSLAWGLFLVSAALLIGGSVLSLIGIDTTTRKWWHNLGFALIAFASAIGAMTLLVGGSVIEWRLRVREWLRIRIRTWLFS